MLLLTFSGKGVWKSIRWFSYKIYKWKNLQNEGGYRDGLELQKGKKQVVTQ